MQELKKFPSICFDDILLLPSGEMNVETRDNADISVVIGSPDRPESTLTLYNPIMIAPMEFISSNKMLEAINSLGGIGFVQRYQEKEARLNQIRHLRHKAGFAISISECYDLDFIKDILITGCRVLLVDTAVGNNRKTLEAILFLRKNIPSNVHISTGNVSSFEGYRASMQAGADSVRVGIGGGAGCTTRISTGFGAPTLSSILDVYSNLDPDKINGLIADGGIKTNGDIVKSLAAGASAVMMGNRFAGHDECDGEVINGMREFRGMASEKAQNNFFGNSKEWAHHVEGASGLVETKGSVLTTIQHMINNIKSGLSYANSSNLKELRDNTEYIVVTSLSLSESKSRV